MFKAEHLFLENIYSEKEMKRMEIDSFEIYCEKLNKILDEPDSLYDSIESENLSASRSGEQDPEIENIINRIKKIKTSREDEGKATKEKRIVFLYQHAINFIPADKIQGDFQVSENFLPNMIFIVKNKFVIQHSHVSGKIIGYIHDFCYQRTRENYYTIPVFANIQFRLDIFLFLKGIRLSVWELAAIEIGGKDPQI